MRASVSIQASTYRRLKHWAATKRRSVSGVLEEIIKHRLDEVGAPEADEDNTTRPREQDISKIIDRHFTF
jgi:predicted CopG family antitoxin